MPSFSLPSVLNCIKLQEIIEYSSNFFRQWNWKILLGLVKVTNSGFELINTFTAFWYFVSSQKSWKFDLFQYNVRFLEKEAPLFVKICAFGMIFSLVKLMHNKWWQSSFHIIRTNKENSHGFSWCRQTLKSWRFVFNITYLKPTIHLRNKAADRIYYFFGKFWNQPKNRCHHFWLFLLLFLWLFLWPFLWPWTNYTIYPNLYNVHIFSIKHCKKHEFWFI